MSRIARQVFTEPSDIARIEQLVCALPTYAKVRVVTRDGETYSGTVTERPATMVFDDIQGNSGINALVRLDDPAVPPEVYLWLGDIAQIERLDPPS